MISIPMFTNEGRVAALPVRRWQLSSESSSVFCVAVASWTGRRVTLQWHCNSRRETHDSEMAMQESRWWEGGYGLFAALLSVCHQTPAINGGAKNDRERSPTVCLINHRTIVPHHYGLYGPASVDF
jgi:hypothetical protein